MKVFGLDFTSRPSRAKPLTLAVCQLGGDTLVVEDLRPLTAYDNEPFVPFARWLADESRPWVAGLDFPFGMPVEAIECFRWLAQEDSVQTWEVYVERIFRRTENPQEFKQLIEQWRHPIRTNKRGELERVRKLRLTDKLAKSHSPLNCIRPPVGQMFYEGVRRILVSEASIVPVRVKAGSNAVIVEAYPRLVANTFVGSARYKDAPDTRGQRQVILTGLLKGKPKSTFRSLYGLSVRMKDRQIEACASDDSGDVLDSVLCAIQAAWSFRHADTGFGVPSFATNAMRAVVALEGWITDPWILKLAARSATDPTSETSP